MAVIFLDSNGIPAELSEVLPDANAGQTTTSIIEFTTDYEGTAELNFWLNNPDPRIKIVDFTKTIQPTERGTITFEVSPPDDSKKAIPVSLSYKPRLVS